MRARFVRLPLFGLVAIVAGGMTVMLAAGPAIAAEGIALSTIPSADSPEAANAA